MDESAASPSGSDATAHINAEDAAQVLDGLADIPPADILLQAAAHAEGEGGGSESETETEILGTASWPEEGSEEESDVPGGETGTQASNLSPARQMVRILFSRRSRQLFPTASGSGPQEVRPQDEEIWKSKFALDVAIVQEVGLQEASGPSCCTVPEASARDEHVREHLSRGFPEVTCFGSSGHTRAPHRRKFRAKSERLEEAGKMQLNYEQLQAALAELEIPAQAGSEAMGPASRGYAGELCDAVIAEAARRMLKSHGFEPILPERVYRVTEGSFRKRCLSDFLRTGGMPGPAEAPPAEAGPAPGRRSGGPRPGANYELRPSLQSLIFSNSGGMPQSARSASNLGAFIRSQGWSADHLSWCPTTTLKYERAFCLVREERLKAMMATGEFGISLSMDEGSQSGTSGVVVIGNLTGKASAFKGAGWKSWEELYTGAPGQQGGLQATGADSGNSPGQNSPHASDEDPLVSKRVLVAFYEREHAKIFLPQVVGDDGHDLSKAPKACYMMAILKDVARRLGNPAVEIFVTTDGAGDVWGSKRGAAALVNQVGLDFPNAGPWEKTAADDDVKTRFYFVRCLQHLLNSASTLAIATVFGTISVEGSRTQYTSRFLLRLQKLCKNLQKMAKQFHACGMQAISPDVQTRWGMAVRNVAILLHNHDQIWAVLMGILPQYPDETPQEEAEALIARQRTADNKPFDTLQKAAQEALADFADTDFMCELHAVDAAFGTGGAAGPPDSPRATLLHYWKLRLDIDSGLLASSLPQNSEEIEAQLSARLTTTADLALDDAQHPLRRLAAFLAAKRSVGDAAHGLPQQLLENTRHRVLRLLELFLYKWKEYSRDDLFGAALGLKFLGAAFHEGSVQRKRWVNELCAHYQKSSEENPQKKWTRREELLNHPTLTRMWERHKGPLLAIHRAERFEPSSWQAFRDDVLKHLNIYVSNNAVEDFVKRMKTKIKVSQGKPSRTAIECSLTLHQSRTDGLPLPPGGAAVEAAVWKAAIGKATENNKYEATERGRSEVQSLASEQRHLRAHVQGACALRHAPLSTGEETAGPD
jgi:hypothetical protein